MDIKKNFRTHVSTLTNIASRAVKFFLSFLFSCFQMLRSLYKSLYSKIFTPTFSDVIQNFREDFSGECKASPKLDKLETERNIDVMREKIDKFNDFAESHKEDLRTFLENISQDFKTKVDLSSFIDQAPEETQISDSQIFEDISFACEILYRTYSLIAAENLKSSYPALKFSSEPYREAFDELRGELNRRGGGAADRIEDIVLYFISTPYMDDCFKNTHCNKEYSSKLCARPTFLIEVQDCVKSIPALVKKFPVATTKNTNETEENFKQRVLTIEESQFMECLNIVDTLEKFPCGSERTFIYNVILADYSRKQIDEMTNEISKPFCKIINTEDKYLMPVIFRASYCIFLNNMQASCKYFKMPQRLQNEISRRLKIVKNWELYLYKGPYPSMLAHSLAKTLQTGVIQKLELI